MFAGERRPMSERAIRFMHHAVTCRRKDGGAIPKKRAGVANLKFRSISPMARRSRFQIQKLD
jgi:hypothetical protein